MSDNSILVQTIPKNSVDEIRIQLSQYRGFDLLDIRVFTELDASKEKVPTKKGVALKVSLLPELVAALEKAQATVIERGLLKDDRAAALATYREGASGM